MKTIARLLTPLAVTAVLAGCAGPVVTKAGAATETVTLSLLAYSSNVSDEADDLAAAAQRTSAGTVVLRKAPATSSGATDGSADAIKAVQDGRVDVAVVAARTFDLQGTKSLQALSAPLVVDSPRQAALLLADPIADAMLGGLSSANVVGLALLYGQLSQPLGYTRPVLVPSDLRGSRVLVRPSAATHAVIEALGGVPDARNGGDAAEAVTKGEVTAAVTSMDRPSGFQTGPAGSTSTVTGNVQLLIKADVVLVNPNVWRGLSPRQQSALRTAATDVRDAAVTRAPRLDEGAQHFCANHIGDVAVATAEQLQQWRAAVAPVVAELAQDDVTRRALDRLREIVVANPSDDHPVACAKAGRPAGTTTGGTTLDPATLAGTWRLDASYENMRKSGASEQDAVINQGTWTFVLQADGTYAYTEPHQRSCPGAFTLTTARLTMTEDASTGDCGGVWEFTWKRAGDRLQLTPTPKFSAENQGMDGFWANPLVRIGDAPAR